MVCISGLILLFHGTGLFSVSLGSPDTLTLVAEPGDDATIWYQHNLMEPAYIYWLKHTDSSVPNYVGCQFLKVYAPPSPCSFVSQSTRITVSVNSQNTSLTIPAVNHTDSGLYYCGIQWGIHISFSNATYLQVTVQNKTPFETSSKKEQNEAQGRSGEDQCSSDVFFMLTVMFSAVTVILISVLLVLLMRSKQHRVTGSQFKQDKEETVNYAALQLSDQKTNRVAGHGEGHVVFCSVRH